MPWWQKKPRYKSTLVREKLQNSLSPMGCFAHLAGQYQLKRFSVVRCAAVVPRIVNFDEKGKGIINTERAAKQFVTAAALRNQWIHIDDRCLSLKHKAPPRIVVPGLVFDAVRQNPLCILVGRRIRRLNRQKTGDNHRILKIAVDSAIFGNLVAADKPKEAFAGQLTLQLAFKRPSSHISIRNRLDYTGASTINMRQP